MDGGGAEPLIPFFLPVFSSPLLDAEGLLPLHMGSIRELLQIFWGVLKVFKFFCKEVLAPVKSTD